MVRKFSERRSVALSLLDEMQGVSYVTPHGAFYIFVDVSNFYGRKYNGNVIDGSLSFANYLLDECGVAVVPGKPFGDDGKIRLSYATSNENIKKGLKRFGYFLNILRK